MRKYLVLIDETDEARVALRFAARRATKTNGAVEILAMIPRPEFVQWGGVQAAMEEEARQRIDAMIAQVAGELLEETGLRPAITIVHGNPGTAIRAFLSNDRDVAALVLGAAAHGAPGPLVTEFTGAGAGALPCPVMIIPGSLTSEALDRLS